MGDGDRSMTAAKIADFEVAQAMVVREEALRQAEIKAAKASSKASSLSVEAKFVDFHTAEVSTKPGYSLFQLQALGVNAPEIALEARSYGNYSKRRRYR